METRILAHSPLTSSYYCERAILREAGVRMEKWMNALAREEEEGEKDEVSQEAG